MSWEVIIVMESDESMAQVSATWTDPDTNLGIFAYSRRSRVSVTKSDAFIAEAIARRDAWQIYQADNNTKSAWALNRLNIADPKVV